MEELNEKQEIVLNEELQNAAGTPADNTDTADAATPNPPAGDEPDRPHDVAAPAAEEKETAPDYSNMDREALLAALNELMQEDVSKIHDRARAVREQFNILNKELEQQAAQAFVDGGGSREDFRFENDATAREFYRAYDAYRARRQKMQEEAEAQKQQNLEAKRRILEELRALIDKDEESLKQTNDAFNAIREKWQGIGEVPREEQNDLWRNYHFLIEQFFNKVKINKELRMHDLKKNLEQKILLCEKAEDLLVETSVTNAFKTLQELRAQWKEIGAVPNEQSDEIWQRFNNAAKQIDDRRREFYDQRKEEMDQNLLAKQALIAKAKELTQEPPKATKAWNDTTEALDELLKLWKSIGPVPRENNEEIWAEFKGTIDRHYADKKQYFNQMRSEQGENYNKKVDLCLRAEAIAKREDWKNATEELLQLQAEWKTVGPAGRKVNDKIWRRFRGACDEFFAKKEEYFKGVRTNESENLEKKKAVIEEIRAFAFGENREENLNALKDFQRRWAEIGYVPMKEKERITTEYRELLDGIFERLKISAREADGARLRTHGARRDPGNAPQDIAARIERLKANLKLWDNNIGFLANSKQADLLKAELERKMESTRQEIALLEARLRQQAAEGDAGQDAQ